ncbi:hypothetical protein JHD50_01995 [Sulfurimonas sp. MAG313]|nr:hypothetical protein [Sulfurimonas sp. MAG313]MDF1880082.1 hypothetical protein [Sulfurimonas sp. MAG313]
MPLSSKTHSKDMLFIGYTLAVLVDLVIINLFNEYWDYITINSFTISLFAAILMQVLLKLTFALEHQIGEHFKKKDRLRPKIIRVVVSYSIVVASKFVILDIFRAPLKTLYSLRGFLKCKVVQVFY